MLRILPRSACSNVQTPRNARWTEMNSDALVTLIRETAFIKEWQTPRGSFIDSKYRWLGVEPSVEPFLAAWRGASGAEKFDLEAAFQFYPYELEEDIEEILSTIAGMGPEDRVRAERMAERL